MRLLARLGVYLLLSSALARRRGLPPLHADPAAAFEGDGDYPRHQPRSSGSALLASLRARRRSTSLLDLRQNSSFAPQTRLAAPLVLGILRAPALSFWAMGHRHGHSHNGHGAVRMDDQDPIRRRGPELSPLPFVKRLSGINNPHIRVVRAPHIYQGEDAGHEIALPLDWCEQFQVGSLGVAGVHFVFGRARLACDPGFEVAFQIAEATPESETAVLAMQRLQHSGSVLSLYESRHVEKAIFFLTESPGEETLESMLFATWEHKKRSGASGDLAMPPGVALDLLIDLLEGLKAMEDAGIVHGSLMESRICVKADHTGWRAVISDFRDARFIDQPGLGAQSLSPAFHHAPEMVGGYPTGLTNNVWQIGLIFARMLAGGLSVPTMTELEKLTGKGGVRSLDLHAGGRDYIRHFVAKKFDVLKSDGIVGLDPEYTDLVGLAAGMLTRDPARRWSASGALEAALKVAAGRGHVVREARERPTLPPEWHDTWQ